MTEPIDLAAARQQREERYDGLVCPDCGSAWFFVNCVALDAERSVTAYAAPVTCRQCGYVLVGGAEAEPSVRTATADDAVRMYLDRLERCQPGPKLQRLIDEIRAELEDTR